jgi:hypothetical protein
MQHSVVRAPELVIFEEAVGITNEIAIREEEQLDDVVHRREIGVCADTPFQRQRGITRGSAFHQAPRSASAEYDSLVDIFSTIVTRQVSWIT